jgi:hypothetical protein
MTREEPSLETLWLQNIETVDEVQRIDRSNTAPSSKTFRDESKFVHIEDTARNEIGATNNSPTVLEAFDWVRTVNFVS